jgi:cell wall-associated NlpC family hydrolase
MGRIIGAVCGGLVLMLVLIAASAAGVVDAFFGGGGGGGPIGCLPATSTASAAPTLTVEQTANADTIVTVGEQMSVPPRGWVIAIATALQESDLVNLTTATDRDSLGLFAQRPSQGWGTAAQITDPAYAAGKFYTKLLTVTGWRTMPLTEAAQAVQRSAYPGAYAKHEAAATAIVATITRGLGQIMCTSTVEAVFVRAASWLSAWHGGPVPYLSSSDPGTWFNGYRRDCSGYVSMALGLSGPGLDTGQLAARSQPITKSNLTAGDLLINPTPGGAGHVVIFDHWTDSTMSAYVGYEESGGSGTHHRIIPYPYFGTYQMSPYRYGSV